MFVACAHHDKNKYIVKYMISKLGLHLKLFLYFINLEEDEYYDIIRVRDTQWF